MTVDFMYIGASRAGSTFLYNVLRQQPNVKFPLGKPVRFWNRHIDGGENIKTNKTFEIWSKEYYYSKFNNSDFIKGDITDGYTQIPQFRIEEIKRENPDCKVLYCIRNPVDIVLSHIGLPAPYENEKINMKMLQRHFESDGQYYKNNIDFAGNIKNWRSVFSDNFYVYLYDDLRDNPKQTIAEICNFIGIDYKFKGIDFSKRINERRKTYTLNKKAEAWLKNHCYDNLRETEELIGRKLNWF